MAYYPLFFDLNNRNIVIIGGGHIACKKAARLHAFGARITMIAPQILESFHPQNDIRICLRTWKPADLKDVFLVIAATDDKEENKAVALACAKQDILCNAVDDAANSEAIFGAVLSQGDLCIGISTSGASPSAAVYLKALIEQILPEHIEPILNWLSSIRPRVICSVPAEQRPSLFQALFLACIEKGRGLQEEEFQSLVRTVTSDTVSKSA